MKKPNIVFVLTDQHRRIAMNFWNNEKYKSHINGSADAVQTPNLDDFAQQSVVFSQAISNNPVCSPYRAMLFSGLFCNSNGVWNNCTPSRDCELKQEIPTFTDILSNCGYDVGYVGKWHLERPIPAFDKEGNFVLENKEYKGDLYFPDGTPGDGIHCWDTLMTKKRQRSIDYLYAYNTWDIFRGNNQMPKLKKPHYWDKHYNRHIVPDGVWTPKYETDLALNYINNNNCERDKEKPFAIFLSYNPPHGPIKGREDTDYEMYDKYDGNLPTRENVLCSDEYNYMFPKGKISNLTGDLAHDTKVYFSHVSGIDKQFGRILKTLQDENLQDDTIVIFSADHGEMLGSHNLMSKNVIFEESIGIPLIIRYGEKIKPHIENMIISGVDIMPTILGLAGQEKAIPNEIHGRDFSSIIEGNEGHKEKSAFFCQCDVKGVRTDRYSMVIIETGENYQTMLFDNINDPYQKVNLRFSDVSEKDLLFLMQELGYWLKKTDDPWYQDKKYKDWGETIWN